MRRTNTALRWSAVGLLLLFGCGDSGDPNVTAPKYDLDFIDTMVRHHVVGIMMAETALERGESRQVRSTAHSLKSIQQDQIAWLLTARERLTGADQRDMEMRAVNVDLASLQQASGAEFDRLFLLSMIAHHEEAIQTADQALANLTDVAVKASAVKILQEEPVEIGLMQDTLADL
jgi:uncharacterized protein (DUF305 family)